MIFIMHFTNRILIFFVFMFILIIQTQAQFLELGVEDYPDIDTSEMNESFPIISTPKITKSTKKPSKSLSTVLKARSTKHTSIHTTNKTTTTVSFKNRTTTFALLKKSSTTQKIPPSVPSMTFHGLANNLLNQFNQFRNDNIIPRIKQCDLNMNLNDMCESYSLDNHTYSLIREPTIEFQSLQHLYNAVVDRIIVEKLKKLCPTGHWCLQNLTYSDIRFTMDVLRQRGRSFCSLEKCHDRLTLQTNTCPFISPQNISTPTLKLLPMLCTLHNERQTWTTNDCIEEIVFLLHMIYAFWPQLETCHRTVSVGSGGCTSECLAFDSILHKVENQCHKNASFLTRVPALAWYRSINLKQICGHDGSATRSPIISSVKNFISSNMIWYRFHQRPVHVALFIIVIFCIVISFSLCLYVMSKNDYPSNARHLDDDYEYTRLHDSTFDVGANTEIPNTNESQFDLNGTRRFTEHQRLLYAES